MINIKAGGQSIFTTPDHPFLVNSKWVEAKNILVGDSLLLINGQKQSVDYKSIRDTFAVVYNFGVEKFHSYYITELGILTHNTGCQEKVYKWTNYNFKHIASNSKSWKETVKATLSGVAKYKHRVDVKALETKVLKGGIDVEGKSWKVMKHDEIVGAKNGVETKYSRVEITPDGTYHGHPITEQEYKKLTKNK